MEPYPPTVSTEHERHLLDVASDYSLSHGLVLRPVAASPSSQLDTTSSIHAPYSLYPCPYPRHLFDHALSLQQAYNQLYARITTDDAFLDDVVGGAVAKVDEFQGKLYEIWTQVKREGVKQPITLGIFRSDYLIHAPEGTDAKDWEIKQVEFNTISASFAALSTRVGQMHRYLLESGHYPSHRLLSPSALPRNAALEGIAAGIAAAHEAYGNPDAVVLMVIQDGERNAFDQRLIEWEVVQRHGVKLLRVPFSSLRTTLELSSDSKLLYTPSVPFPSSTGRTALEVSLVYYRTAYAPTDYYTSQEWDTRLLIERSCAIKCPSVAMQLAGAKKVQQVLADRTRLERFFGKDVRGGAEQGGQANEREMEDRLFESFTGLWPMDDSPLGLEGQRRARDEPQHYVLKPQREGGGNNIYRRDIPTFLDQLEREDEARRIGPGEPKGREGYILMSLIEPPKDQRQAIVKAGEREARHADVVSELGVYGVVLLKEGGVGSNDKDEVLRNETVGHLLRTKGRESDEGGIAVGHSCLDSVLLF